ncbi:MULTISPECIES: nicotinate-nucleotide adenylyltransferase [Peptoniphilus]|uniref:nicotinate-nucleotide adenylyltransferase n=1 Tax=Peptoniphilus TaxID=162289 RepID=UPI0002F60B09|nr:MULTISPECIES: nicotinate-nucleotide adenylyltransferase [Peptoniphilus]
MKKYGIMGGTFNPIHFGHLMISEYIRIEMELDKIIFIPTGNPPHKKTIDAKFRFEMTSIAIEDNENFMISDIETNKIGNSYSIDTVKQLKNKLDGKFYFIIGSDTLFQLRTWKKFDELSEEVEFICAVRPNYTASEDLRKELKELEKYNATVHVVETPLYEISSTDLRNRFKLNKSVKYLVPDNVIIYINDNKLYRG